MKNLNEVDERCFLSEKEALDFYANVCNTDIWKRCYTNELEAMPIDNAPILMEQIITTLGILSMTHIGMMFCRKLITKSIKPPRM